MVHLEAALLLVLLGISAFFSAAEVAFLSMSRIRIHSLVERKVPGSESMARLRERRRRVIIVLLIGSNVANVSASALATEVALGTWGEEGLGIAIGVMTFLILTFTDIVPKSFATSNGERFMLLFSPVIEAFYWITYPFVIVFELINRLIPGVYSRATAIEQFTEDEVRSAVKLGAKHKSITEKEKVLIENVLAFEDRTVAQAMTPRSRAIALPADMTVAAAHRKAVWSGYSRFPVLSNERKPVGTVSVRMLGRALYDSPNASVRQVCWEPVIFRINEKAHKAFAKMQEKGRNIAIVVDEKDEFAGVVTLEDLLEEIVGEIK